MKLLTKFVNIINNVIDFFKINYDNDYAPVPDYPWIEINSNLHWRINTNHPEFIKNIIGFKYEVSKTEENQGIPYDMVGSKGIMVAKAEPVNLWVHRLIDKVIPPHPPAPPPSREFKCTFFGFVETQESIDKTRKYRGVHNNE